MHPRYYPADQLLTHCKQLGLALLLCLSPLCYGAIIHTISSAAELTELEHSLIPGDSIVLKNGTYNDQQFLFKGQGTQQSPITLRAETAGKVILNGSSTLTIAGEHLIVDGLFFNKGAIESGSVIEFEEDEPHTARHCTLRNTAIFDYNPSDPEIRYFWVTLNGYGNVVEHCTFSGQAHSGVTVVVRLENGVTAAHTIRNNHFKDRPEGNGNGFETIRIGTGSKRETNARCVVANNLFESCNGEIEIISSKSCENTISGNTFIACAGTVTLRQGNRCVVENNVFIAQDVDGSGGLRITGQDHRITGNYFSGTQGKGGAAIALVAGTPGNPRGGYQHVQRCHIEGNTMVDNLGPLFALDVRYKAESDNLLPVDVTISDTLMVQKAGSEPVIKSNTKSAGILWQDNHLVTATPENKLPEGIRVTKTLPMQFAQRVINPVVNRSNYGAHWLR